MRYFVIILVLAIHVVLVTSQGGRRQAGGSTDGDGSISENGSDNMDNSSSDGDGSVNPSASASGQIGGCSAGASGSGSMDGAKGSGGGSASANCETPGAGYTYVINATRTVNVFPGGHPAAYMYYEVSPTQNLTWFRAVGPDDPLMIQGFVFNDYKIYFSNDEDHLLNSCNKQPNGTWQFLVMEVVRKSVLLGGDCSVKKGNYMINQDVDPITVTLPEMIDCGNNTVAFNGYVAPSQEDSSASTDSEWIWAFQLYFDFEIDDNCNEQTTDDN